MAIASIPAPAVAPRSCLQLITLSPQPVVRTKPLRGCVPSDRGDDLRSRAAQGSITRDDPWRCHSHDRT